MSASGIDRAFERRLASLVNMRERGVHEQDPGKRRGSFLPFSGPTIMGHRVRPCG